MTTHFDDTRHSVGVSLQHLIASLTEEQITLRALLATVGEQGILLCCVVLTLPFLFPVSVPGVSTLFGIVIILFGISLTRNSLPWIPARLMDRPINSAALLPVLERGVGFFQRVERWMRPRLTRVTTGAKLNRVNGLALTAGGVLLLFPLSFIPFSNTLPALAVLLLALGMMQRDGYFVVGGYAALAITTLYFGGLAALVYVGGTSLMQLTF